MWYVIQAVTGQEKDVLCLMETLLSREYYRRCFFLKAEWMKRLGGKWQIQVRPLFPGYVFVETDEPEILFMELKAVPKLTKLLGDGQYGFVPLERQEEQFLRTLLGESEDTVKLTTVTVSDDNEILSIEGALKYFENDILQLNLHKRYAVVRLRMMGEEKTALIGICLRKDIL